MQVLLQWQQILQGQIKWSPRNNSSKRLKRPVIIDQTSRPPVLAAHDGVNRERGLWILLSRKDRQKQNRRGPVAVGSIVSCRDRWSESLSNQHVAFQPCSRVLSTRTVLCHFWRLSAVLRILMKEYTLYVIPNIKLKVFFFYIRETGRVL